MSAGVVCLALGPEALGNSLARVVVIGDMAPRKGETADQKAQRYNQQAALFLQKARYERVLKALKQRPDVLPDVERQLKDLKVLDEPGETLQSPMIKRKQEDTEMTPMKGQEDEQCGDCGKADLNDDGKGEQDMAVGVQCTPAIHWDRNVTRCEQLPVAILKKALGAAEKSTFSVANIKSIVKKGAREPSQPFLVQCLEFVSNLDPNSTIEFKYRQAEAFTTWVEELNIAIGRRARDLVLADAFECWEDPMLALGASAKHCLHGLSSAVRCQGVRRPRFHGISACSNLARHVRLDSLRIARGCPAPDVRSVVWSPIALPSIPKLRLGPRHPGPCMALICAPSEPLSGRSAPPPTVLPASYGIAHGRGNHCKGTP